MAGKKFAGVGGAVSDAAVEEDFASAAIFDKVRVGKKGVFFRDGLKMKFVPYDYIERAFIRIQEVNGRMCCGNTTFAYFRLVFVHDGKEFADVLSENEKSMDDALAAISAAAPGVSIGVQS